MAALTCSRASPIVGSRWLSAKEAIFRLRERRYPCRGDAQRGGPLLHGGRDRALDVAFGRGLEHDYLQPEAARGDLRLLDDILRDARIGWIHQ